MITPLEVLDTAIKIGLGAFISGVAAYWLAKLNHDRELNKERARRKRELLEGVAESFEQFNHVALRYWALIGYRKSLELRSKQAPASPPLQLDQAKTDAEQAFAELFNSFKELTSAEAKLLLLGENECQRLLRNYGDFINKFRAESSRISPDKASIYLTEARETFLNKRKVFFDRLSAAYGQQRT